MVKTIAKLLCRGFGKFKARPALTWTLVHHASCIEKVGQDFGEREY